MNRVTQLSGRIDQLEDQNLAKIRELESQLANSFTREQMVAAITKVIRSKNVNYYSDHPDIISEANRILDEMKAAKT